MSFFGFDTTLPRDKPSSGGNRGFFEAPDPFAEVARAQTTDLQGAEEEDDDVLDFEDTYDGLGDQLDDDQDTFNDDTFGGGGGDDIGDAPVGRDFDFFGRTAQVADAFGEEQVRYNLQHPGAAAAATEPGQETIAVAPAAAQEPKPKRSGYEKYNDPGYIPDLQAKSSVWGLSSSAKKQQPVAEPVPSVPAAKKILSLEEVEAQLRQGSGPSGPPQPPVSMPPPFPEHGHPFPPQQLPPFLPEAFAQLPPEILQAELAKAGAGAGAGGPPAQMLHQQRQAMMSEPYPPLPPQAPPGIPLHLLQNADFPPHMVPPPQHHAMPPPRPLPQQQQQQQQQPPVPPQALRGGVSNANLPVITNPQQLMQLSDEQRMAYLLEDAKRAKRNHKIFILSRHNGLMTPQDKNFITRIQLQQLVAAAGNVGDSDPETVLSEDFYYQVYSQIRGAPRQHPHQPLGHFAQTYLFQTGNRFGGHGSRRPGHNADNHMQRMQQQVQRAVEAAKLKPKSKQLMIEGSLGKISFSNAKAPRTMLNVKRPESSEGGGAGTAGGGSKAAKKTHTDLSHTDRKYFLNNLEKVYNTLMALEDMERTMPPPPEEDDTEAIQRHMEWRQKTQSLNQKLWQDLKVMDPIVPNANTPHPFIAFLSYDKGKKAIPRIFRHMDPEQRVTILTMIVVHLDTLDVVRRAQLAPGEAQPSPEVREAVDLFSHAVMPSLLMYVSEAPFNVIIGLLGLVIAQTHLQTVSKTRIGLGILTMMLSRAEIVKEAGQASEQDWQQWVEKFNVLFDTLEPILPDIFPSSINAGDDMYVWQFLAAVGIGASPEQQQRLVIAVKDRVMETVNYSKTLPADMATQRLGNVNLFMRAIGLDVELLG